MKVGVKTVDFRAYVNGISANDIMEVELPEIEFTTDEISGGGISGKIDMPTILSPESMEMTIKTRVAADSASYANLAKGGSIEIRWAVDTVDSKTGMVDLVGNKVFSTCITKGINDGTLESGEAQECEFTYEITTYKRVVNGVTTVEIDKFNNILKIGGVDYSSKLSSLL